VEEQRFNGCFACGQDNPIGLQLCFSYQDGKAKADFTCPQLYAGYPGVIHGGIISTLLDEAMAKAILISGKNAVTAQMTVHFRQPMLSGSIVHVCGWIIEAKTRTIKTAAEIIGGEGNIIATAEGVFIVTGG
jgi:uncharacterized protein (TIGR00369 family)